MGKNTMPLLQNLTEDELASIVEIGAMRENTFDKNEVIFHAGERIREIGMVESGSVLIESNDLWGNCSILSKITPGQVFAESYALSHMAMMVDAIAIEKTKIVFLNAAIVLDETHAGAAWQAKLLRNMLAMAKRKCVMGALCVATQAKKNGKNGLKIIQKPYRLLLSCRTLSKNKDLTDLHCVITNIL